MALKPLSVLVLCVALIGCDIPRPSDVVCDCQIQPESELSEWDPIDQAPTNFIHSEIRLEFDPEDKYMGTPEDFDAASIHWYRNDAGESLACVVYDGSNHVRAMFVFSADTTQTEPIDSRLMGIPLGRDPYFWERRCDGK